MRTSDECGWCGVMAVAVFAAACFALASVPGAIPPAPIDSAFSTGDADAVSTAVAGSDVFKKAVAEAVKARDARKAELATKPVGLTPEQAARTRFIEVLQGK